MKWVAFGIYSNSSTVVINITLLVHWNEGLCIIKDYFELEWLKIFFTSSLPLSLLTVPLFSLPLSSLRLVRKLAQLFHPPPPQTSHCVAPLPCAFPTVPIPWRVHAHPDRMPVLPNALHPLLPITTTSFSSCVPALANSSLRPPRLRPAPLQHGGWGNYHEGWRHQRQHAGLAGLLGRVHPGQHLEHSQRQRQAEKVETTGVPHLHVGGHAHPQHGHSHHHVLCHNAAPSALQLRVERRSVQGVCLHLLHSHVGHLLLCHLALLSPHVDGTLACKLQVRHPSLVLKNCSVYAHSDLNLGGAIFKG